MIPARNLKIRLNPPADIPVGRIKPAGGFFTHGWCINFTDQTVSVWRCSDDTVVATVTLTAGKTFNSGFYRPVNKSLYVMGALYFDRIDLDPNSGTFCTVVESGATLFTTGAVINYLPPPFDAVGCLNIGGAPDFWPIKYINDNNWDDRQYWFSKDSKFKFSPRVGHNVYSNAQLLPMNRKVYIGGGANTPTYFDIFSKSRNTKQFRKYVLRRNDDIPGDLAQSMVSTFLFSNFIPCITNGSMYIMSRYSGSPLLQTLATGLGSSVYFVEYCPNAKKLFVATKTLNVSMYVASLGNKTLTAVGTIDRTSYKATDEDSTDNMLYNPVYGKLYVQGHRHAATPTTVNKIHVYDPTQVLASMYQSSITVGNMGGAGRSGNYALNGMGFNGTTYRESNHGI